eukprot:scaffold4973_cov135-Cylindrotheca_fusiformis.AAC.15
MIACDRKKAPCQEHQHRANIGSFRRQGLLCFPRPMLTLLVVVFGLICLNFTEMSVMLEPFYATFSSSNDGNDDAGQTRAHVDSQAEESLSDVNVADDSEDGSDDDSEHRSDEDSVIGSDENSQRSSDEEPDDSPDGDLVDPGIYHNTAAMCVLIKDDGEILNEWIAYHYHVLNLRHLIVAVDPLSETSPERLLRKWEKLFGMNIELWYDEDYMPEFFLKGKYDKVGSFNIPLPSGVDKDQVTIVNNYVFRQRTFASHCLLSIKQRPNDPHENGKWVALVDTDEYISLNPKAIHNADGNRPPVVLPESPFAGSLLNYLNDFFRFSHASNLSRRCHLMPRILYLPKSRNSKQKQQVIDTSIWNTDRFETLRWEVHRDLTEPTGSPKAILDVAAVPEDHKIFQDERIRGIHMPLGKGPTECGNVTTAPDLNDLNRYPLVVNHYFGSLERYLGRTDSRRDESIWRKKVALNGTLGDGWILGWLPSFVEEHGLEKVSQVLQEYRHLE